MALLRKLWRGLIGLMSALWLNLKLLRYKLQGKHVILLQLHGATQLPHIASLVDEFAKHPGVCCLLLTPPVEIAATQDQVKIPVHSYNSTWFLLFWNAVIAVDQGMRLPKLNWFSGHRICLFHGQPSKGNSYLVFNHQQFDDLYFYGEMMKQKFLTEQARHPEWQGLMTHDVGQPKSDAFFTTDLRTKRRQARQALKIPETAATIIYAPSFESCGSLARQGKEIIHSLAHKDRYLIVKPHPAFFRIHDPQDQTYRGVAHAAQWHDTARELTQTGRVIFPTDQQLPPEVAVPAADVLVTDHSGIAFDAILLDIPVIFIHCAEFFDHYLPERFGVDGKTAVDDITCNAGRPAGTVVDNLTDLEQAVQQALANPDHKQTERDTVRANLLFNQGKATEAAVAKTLELISAK